MSLLNIQSKNIMPRSSRTQDIKPWQKLAVARAAQATLSRSKTDTTGKEAYALRSFISNCELIVQTCPSLIPFNCTAQILCQDGQKQGSCLTGKQVWSSWDTLSREIENEVIPMFIKSGILNSDNSIPSGLQMDDIYYRFRKYAFDQHFNAIVEFSQPLVQAEEDIEAESSSRSITTDLVDEGKKKRGRKKMLPGERKPFDEEWFPNWWLAFAEHGPLSNQPIVGWIFKKLSSGPQDSDDHVGTESMSRRDQRKRGRDDIRENNALCKSSKTMSPAMSTSSVSETSTRLQSATKAQSRQTLLDALKFQYQISADIEDLEERNSKRRNIQDAMQKLIDEMTESEI
jgi:hypothetical protein